MSETHKMRQEELKAAGEEAFKRPSGEELGGVLHQRRKLPLRPVRMAIGGFVFAATVGYFTLYAHKKPEASAGDVAKVAVGGDTRPRK